MAAHALGGCRGSAEASARLVDRPFQPRPTPLPPGLGPRRSIRWPALCAHAHTRLFRDPPDHTRLRGLVNKAFTPRVVERLRPRIEAVVEELLGACADDGGMDLIADLLGIPLEDYKELKRWSDDLALMLDGSIAAPVAPRAVTSASEFVDYLRKVMAQRRAQPGDDLLSEMLAVQEKDDSLTEDEILGTSVLLLGAGHEATTNLIGNGGLALAPPERARSASAGSSSAWPTLWRNACVSTRRYRPLPGYWLKTPKLEATAFPRARKSGFSSGPRTAIPPSFSTPDAGREEWRPGFLSRGVEYLALRF